MNTLINDFRSLYALLYQNSEKIYYFYIGITLKVGRIFLYIAFYVKLKAWLCDIRDWIIFYQIL